MKEYNKANIKVARILRKNMTVYERKLWYLFLKDYPIRFQRQKAIGDFIVDFYCAKAKLVIELDGKGHDRIQQSIYDIQRTSILNNMNLEVLRISNSDLNRDFRGVCTMIHATVSNKIK